jgi:hypothetical protein
LAKVEITHIGLETLSVLEQYMAEFIQDPESLSNQLIDFASERLGAFPESCPVCPELEELGVLDYLQLTVDESYKVLYRYDSQSDTVFITAFMRTKQSAEKLLVRIALIS